MNGPEARSNLPFDFLATVARNQPQLLEELPPRDAYILLAHSDIKNTRTLAEMAPFFGISTCTIGRVHRRTLRQVFKGANPEIQTKFPLEEVEARIRANHMITSIEATRRVFEDPERRPKILRRQSLGHIRSYTNNPELRRKTSLASAGRHHTEETKAKIRAKLKGRKRPLEVFASSIGKPRTADVRAKISATRIRKFKEKREGQDVSSDSTGKKSTIEARRRMRDSAVRFAINQDNRTETREDVALWKYALVRNLLTGIVEAGFLTAAEEDALRQHFEKGRKVKNLERLLNQLSLGVANLD